MGFDSSYQVEKLTGNVFSVKSSDNTTAATIAARIGQFVSVWSSLCQLIVTCMGNVEDHPIQRQMVEIQNGTCNALMPKIESTKE